MDCVVNNDIHHAKVAGFGELGATKIWWVQSEIAEQHPLPSDHRSWYLDLRCQSPHFRIRFVVIFVVAASVVIFVVVVVVVVVPITTRGTLWSPICYRKVLS